VVEAASPGTAGCIFCEALSGAGGDLIVHRARLCFVILNKFPYNNGHLMVVPHRHVGRLADLGADELHDIADVTQLCESVLQTVYHPHGLNVGLNLGKPAGAGVLDHLHVHLVPRWDGDTNFMSVVGETRVLPEELPATADRLRAVFTTQGN
jgi:ATP adenylyltransferase